MEAADGVGTVTGVGQCDQNPALRVSGCGDPPVPGLKKIGEVGRQCLPERGQRIVPTTPWGRIAGCRPRDDDDVRLAHEAYVVVPHVVWPLLGVVVGAVLEPGPLPRPGRAQPAR